MEDPVKDISDIIITLTTAPPSEQKAAIYKYYTPTASFAHPLCRTGSFNGSRWLILQIYRWYKILSPRIEPVVDSVAFDEPNLLLYVSLRQKFKIPVVPYYLAHVTLTTVLALTTDPDAYHAMSNPKEPDAPVSMVEHKRIAHGSDADRQGKKYYIQSQNDLYALSEWVKFILPWGIGVTTIVSLQIIATFWCVVGAVLGKPLTFLEENVFGGNAERFTSGTILGKD